MTRPRVATTMFLALVLLASALPVGRSVGTWSVVTDGTPSSGLGAFKHAGFKTPGSPTYQESTGAGACWGDYDNDGYPDLYLTDAGDPSLAPKNHLYHNTKGGTFDDVTSTAGVGASGWYQGCAWGDYDNDGCLDLYVAGYGGGRLYHQVDQGGCQGRFEDVTATTGVGDSSLEDCQAGSGHACWGTSAVWIDYDRDGFLDLYVTNYVELGTPSCSNANLNPNSCPGEANVLYHNNGDGTFTNRAAEAGVQFDSAPSHGRSLSATAGDVNGDGWPDLWVANDEDAPALYVNNGDGTFTDKAAAWGWNTISNPSSCGSTGCAGMGVDLGDHNDNGLVDGWTSHFNAEKDDIYSQTSGTQFSDAGDATGINDEMGRVRWGGGWLSFRNDLYPDYLVVAGDAGKDASDPQATYLYFYHNATSSYTNEVTNPESSLWDSSAMKNGASNSRAAAFADVENDGDVDVYSSALYDSTNGAAANRLWINHAKDATSPFASNHYLDVTLVGTTGSNRAGIGATLRLAAGGVTQTKFVSSGDSYEASHELRVHFGLGGVTAGTLTVDWPATRADGSQCVETYTLASRDVDNPVFKLGEPAACSRAPPATTFGDPIAVGSTNATLAWAPRFVTDFDSYVVYWGTSEDFSPDASSTHTSIAGATKTNVTVSGLSPSTQYYFKVRVKDKAGQFSDPSPALSITTTKLPPPPVTLALGSVSTSTIAVSWTTSTEPHFSSYEVLLDGKPVANANFTDVAHTNFTATDLLDATTHTLVVRSWNQDLLFADSDAVTATTTNAPPPAVTLRTPASANVTDSTVRLAWSKSTAHDFASYDLYVDGATPAPYATFLDASTTSAIASGLVDDSNYTFHVDVVDAGGLATSSNLVHVATKPRSPPPVVPRVDGANATPSSVAIVWTPTKLHDFARYEVYAGPTPDFTRDAAHLVASSTDAATGRARVGGLPDATDVFVVVRIVTTAGLVSDSAPLKATTANAPPPAVTLDPPTVDASAGTLALHWSESTAHDFARYEILLGDGATLPFASITDRNVTTFTAEGLAPARYAFRVGVVDAGGLSSLSDPAIAVLPPPPRFALVATAEPDAANALLVRWTYGAAGVIDGFTVATDGAPSVSLGPASDRYEATGLVPGASVCFRVTLAAHDGTTEAAAPACATVPDPNGKALVAWDLTATPSDHSVDLRWLSPEGAVAKAMVSIDGVPVATLAGTPTGETARHVAHLSRLRDGTLYSWHVDLSRGTERASSPARVFTTLPDRAAPHAPRALVATTTSAGVPTLTWNASPDDDIAGYHILRVASDGSTTDVARVAADAALSWKDRSPLTQGARTYRVVAVDLAGRTSEPAEVAATAPDGISHVDEPLARSATNSTVKLTESQANRRASAPGLALVAGAALGVAIAARRRRKT